MRERSSSRPARPLIIPRQREQTAGSLEERGATVRAAPRTSDQAITYAKRNGRPRCYAGKDVHAKESDRSVRMHSEYVQAQMRF